MIPIPHERVQQSMGILWLVNGVFYRDPRQIPDGSHPVIDVPEAEPVSQTLHGVPPNRPAQAAPAVTPVPPATLGETVSWPPPNSEVAAKARPDLEGRPGQSVREEWRTVDRLSPTTILHNQFKDLNEYPSTVTELMTRGVVTVTQGHTVQQALETLQEHDFHHLPVVDQDDRLVGLVSDHDLLGREGDLEDRMITRVLTASPDTGVREATEALVEQRFHSLVVIDSQSRPMGIITSFDLLRYLVEHPAMKLWQKG